MRFLRCCLFWALSLTTSLTALAEEPRPIDAPDYDPKSFMPRQGLENYFGLPLTSGGVADAEFMRHLRPAERTGLLTFSNFPEDARRRHLDDLFKNRARGEEQVAQKKAEGKSLEPYIGLTLADGTVVTQELLDQIDPLWQAHLMAFSTFPEKTRIQGLQLQVDRLRKYEADEIEAIKKADAANEQKAQKLAERQRQEEERKAQRQREMEERKAEHARAQAEFEQRQAQQLARQEAESKARREAEERERERLAAEEAQKRAERIARAEEARTQPQAPEEPTPPPFEENSEAPDEPNYIVPPPPRPGSSTVPADHPSRRLRFTPGEGHKSIEQFRRENGMQSNPGQSTSFRISGRAIKGLLGLGFLMFCGFLALLRWLINAIRGPEPERAQPVQAANPFHTYNSDADRVNAMRDNYNPFAPKQ